jgi:hypothetical protein
MINVRVVVASEEQLKQAGVQIRYMRIKKFLKKFGTNLNVSSVDSLSNTSYLNDDIYLLSKCYDIRAQILAKSLKERGKIVGVDLFDDYFSQSEDSRLGRFRAWLRCNVQFADFILSSTSAMLRGVEHYLSGQPTHILNDPAEVIDQQKMSACLEDKAKRLTNNGSLTVAWFGMGDNPRFPVGLRDLVGYADRLLPIRDSGFDVKLEILTNQRALTKETMIALKRLPLQYQVKVWSRQAQDHLLAESDICFLPVNAQPFSVVKSLNRAITALTAGAQVLNVGYPLYHPLSELLYRSPKKLAEDLKSGSLIVRADNVSTVCRALELQASAEKEAERLHAFFAVLLSQGQSDFEANSSQDAILGGAVSRGEAVLSRALQKWGGAGLLDENVAHPILGIVQGQDSSKKFAKFAKKFDALLIATPFTSDKSDCDIRFEIDRRTGAVITYVSENLLKLLGQECLDAYVIEEKLNRRTFFRKCKTISHKKNIEYDMGNIFVILTHYREMMDNILEILEKILPGTDFIISEHSKYPLYFYQKRTIR